MTGRPQAVMVHVNVGTGNTINNVTNLSRDRAPLILCAGRTPFTEKGSFGSRTRSIHWAQEMFDQAGMLREMVKWDYELKVPDQVADVAARAYEMTMTSPRGPVYLVLPREPLSAPVSEALASAPRQLPALGHPDPQAIATLAQWIAKAEQPLIITSSDGDPRAVAALVEACRALRAAGGQSQCPRGDACLRAIRCMPATIPRRWCPRPISSSMPNATCPGIRISTRRGRAANSRISARTRSISAIRCARSRAISLSPRARPLPSRRLHAALEQHLPAMSAAIERRRKQAAERRKARREKVAKDARGAPDKITPHYLSHCHRRGLRHRRRDLQRISALASSIARARSRKPSTRSALPAASAGGSAPPSARSSPRPRS